MNKEAIVKIVLKYQAERALEKFYRNKRRDQFVKRRIKKILSLSMDGWPRTKNMKDYPKWLEIVIEAKIQGIYGFGTSNCDIIMRLLHRAKQLSPKQ